MVATFREGLARNAEEGEAAMNRYREEVPMGRFLAPDEIAAMALYLASEEAAGITGQGYTISCGRDTDLRKKRDHCGSC